MDSFSDAPPITDDEALQRVVKAAGAGPEDTVLDVACGPGLIVCSFAAVVRRATGIDLTPAMIDRARRLQEQRGLTNVAWRVGDVVPLPFSDDSFSIVTSRYAFHHFENPAAVIAEMRRVCIPRGRVLLIDVFTSADPQKAAAYNRMERLRDPSHARAMPVSELEQIIRDAGLRLLHTSFYDLDFALEKVLQGSSPDPGSADAVRQMFVEEMARPAMGLQVRREGTEIHFKYPIVILSAEK